MPQSPFRIAVSDLVGHPGARRTETLVGALTIDLDQVQSCGEATAIVQLEAIADGLIVRGSVAAPAVLRCNRCLTEVPFAVEAAITQAYGLPSEEDILEIEANGSIDLGPALHDELSLEFPLAPLCTEGCLGLCPTCGTDLNKDPCRGHPEESSSPFGALKDLLDTQRTTGD